MFHNNILSVFIVICWLYSTGECGVIASKKSLREDMTGGNENFPKKNNLSELDCSQFIDDYDIIRQFPFPVVINPTTDDDYQKSTVTMHKDGIFVKSIIIHKENVVPLSMFCLLNLESLQIVETPFENGIVPDALGNLKKLQEISFDDTPMVKMTEQLGTLTNLSILMIFNCSLTQLPNLSNLQQLGVLDVIKTRISHIDELPSSVRILQLDMNRLTEMPMAKNRENLVFLSIIDNPLKTMTPIMSYKNLEGIFLKNTSLTSIPPAIDTLQNLRYLDLSENELSYLPTTMLNLPYLEYLNISTNLLSPSDIRSIRTALKKSHPKLEFFS